MFYADMMAGDPKDMPFPWIPLLVLCVIWSIIWFQMRRGA